ncbi:hypothetical protein RI129_009789 [Pyrocoelia pectoralis]|uniref:Exosome complex component RRP40 n=1 Tax=Pyrocoelia pectoralis TaxID=417401 RepID=A0AAN7ZG72_9COLE
MSIKIGEFVFPGDVLRDLTVVNGVILKGPGLHSHEEPNCLLVTRAGILCFKSPNTYWIDGQQKRYYPKRGDLVVGIIKKTGNICKVDIGSSELSSLSMLSFEGATKKQKPDLQVGDIVYAKLLSAHREMESELVCIDSYYKAGKLGPLSNDGFIMNISLNFVNRILDINCPLLKTLGQKYVFEIAIGMNGKVWINAKKTKDILNLMNALLAAEQESNSNIIKACKQYAS